MMNQVNTQKIKHLFTYSNNDVCKITKNFEPIQRKTFTYRFHVNVPTPFFNTSCCQFMSQVLSWYPAVRDQIEVQLPKRAQWPMA